MPPLPTCVHWHCATLDMPGTGHTVRVHVYASDDSAVPQVVCEYKPNGATDWQLALAVDSPCA